MNDRIQGILILGLLIGSMFVLPHGGIVYATITGSQPDLTLGVWNITQNTVARGESLTLTFINITGDYQLDLVNCDITIMDNITLWYKGVLNITNSYVRINNKIYNKYYGKIYITNSIVEIGSGGIYSVYGDIYIYNSTVYLNGYGISRPGTLNITKSVVLLNSTDNFSLSPAYVIYIKDSVIKNSTVGAYVYIGNYGVALLNVYMENVTIYWLGSWSRYGALTTYTGYGLGLTMDPNQVVSVYLKDVYVKYANESALYLAYIDGLSDSVIIDNVTFENTHYFPGSPQVDLEFYNVNNTIINRLTWIRTWQSQSPGGWGVVFKNIYNITVINSYFKAGGYLSPHFPIMIVNPYVTVNYTNIVKGKIVRFINCTFTGMPDNLFGNGEYVINSTVLEVDDLVENPNTVLENVVVEQYTRIDTQKPERNYTFINCVFKHREGYYTEIIAAGNGTAWFINCKFEYMPLNPPSGQLFIWWNRWGGNTYYGKLHWIWDFKDGVKINFTSTYFGKNRWSGLKEAWKDDSGWYIWLLAPPGNTTYVNVTVPWSDTTTIIFPNGTTVKYTGSYFELPVYHTTANMTIHIIHGLALNNKTYVNVLTPSSQILGFSFINEIGRYHVFVNGSAGTSSLIIVKTPYGEPKAVSRVRYDGRLVELARVNSLAELEAATDAWYYDPATGLIYIKVLHHSPVDVAIDYISLSGGIEYLSELKYYVLLSLALIAIVLACIVAYRKRFKPSSF